MNKIKLTQHLVNKLEYTGQNNARCIVWDTDIKGFGIRAYPSGRKAYTIMYRVDGKQRQMSIGDAAVIKLAKARREASQKIGDIAGGVDPLEIKTSVAQIGTFEALCIAYIEEHAKPNKRSWQEDDLRIQRHLKPWYSRQPYAITQSNIRRLHERVRISTPYEANRLLSLISSLFMFALRDTQGPGESSRFLPVDHINPCPNLTHIRHKEQQRKKRISREQMPGLASSIEQEDNIYIRAAFWLLLLTGMRKNEVLRLRWDNVDQQAGVITLTSAQTKTDNEHVIPISKAVGQIFITLKRDRAEGNPYVIQGKKDDSHLVNISKAWIRIRTRANLPDIHIHDLRRTAASLMLNSGVKLEVVSKLLNHADIRTTQIYARLDQQPVADALEDHGKVMAELGFDTDADDA